MESVVPVSLLSLLEMLLFNLKGHIASLQREEVLQKKTGEERVCLLSRVEIVLPFDVGQLVI